MPHISRIKLSKRTEGELIESLNIIFSSITIRNEMLMFLNALFTDTEKLMLAKRIAVIILIDEGLSDSEIANKIHMTRITVSKIRYFYEARGKKGYSIALRKIEKDKQLQSFKQMLVSLGKYSIKAVGRSI